MLNDRSSILSLLETRRSGKPRELIGPGPTPGELERMLTIAARTPDHGTLTPWRFVTVADDGRDAFEALLQQALLENDPDAPPAKRQKEQDFAHYEGSLVVLISAPVKDHKIPLWEQELSCGAAGMNLLLAAHALGYTAGWVTGWRAYSERVRAAFCEPGERIAGKYGDGDPLPSVRAFAAEQQANPLTVAKAYQGFQDEGLIVVKRGVGMFVAPGARTRLGDSERSQFLKQEWPEISARMKRLGIDPASLIERERA